MLRALVTLGGTAAGLAALLAFKTHAPASATAGGRATMPLSALAPTAVSPAAGAPTAVGQLPDVDVIGWLSAGTGARWAANLHR